MNQSHIVIFVPFSCGINVCVNARKYSVSVITAQGEIPDVGPTVRGCRQNQKRLDSKRMWYISRKHPQTQTNSYAYVYIRLENSAYVGSGNWDLGKIRQRTRKHHRSNKLEYVDVARATTPFAPMKLKCNSALRIAPS